MNRWFIVVCMVVLAGILNSSRVIADDSLMRHVVDATQANESLRTTKIDAMHNEPNSLSPLKEKSQKESLTVAFPVSDYSYLPEKDKIRAYVNDFMHQWASTNGYTITVVDKSLEQIRRGLADGSIDIATPAPTQIVQFYPEAVSIPIIRASGSLYSRDVEDINKYTALYIPEFSYPAYLSSSNKVLVNSARDSEVTPYIDKVNYVYTIGESPLTEALLERGFRKEEQNESSLYYSIMVSRKKLRLRKELNQYIVESDPIVALNQWYEFFDQADGVYETLVGSYDKNLYNRYPELFGQKLLWKFSHSHKGNPPGLITERFFLDGHQITHLKQLQRRLGVLFVPVPFHSFSESMTALRFGNVDLQFPLFKTDDRKHLSFTLPVGDSVAAVASHEGYESLIELEGKRVAMVAGSAENDILLSLVDVEPVYAKSKELALDILKEREADAFLSDLFMLSYIKQQQNWKSIQVKRLTDKDLNRPTHMALSPANSEYLTMFDYTIKSLSGEFHEEMRQRWQSHMLGQSIDEQVEQFRLLYLGIIAAVVLLASIVVVASVKNNREKVRLTSALQSALEESDRQKGQALKLAEAKTDFLARMSHEIRTPMNGVLGMTEALVSTELTIKQRELLTSLDRSANNLLSLLNDVLDFSKFESGKMNISNEQCYFPSILQACKDNFGQKAEEKGLKLNVECAMALECWVSADTTRLIQVVNNLVSNAIKFTHKGAVSLRASVVTQTDKSLGVIISVQDTGMGIAEENLTSLFDPFNQADDEIAKVYGGTGLGLSICKEIVEAMDGTISASSIQGIGSQFRVGITLEKVQKQSAMIHGTMDDLDDIDYPELLKGLRVLCVEDNPINITVISNQLERLDVAYMCAKDGVEALAVLEKHQFDVVLSDCHMPRMDGYQLATELKSRECSEILVALTADAQMGSAQKCLEAGFDTYLSKPCRIESLRSTLLDIANQNRLSNLHDLSQVQADVDDLLFEHTNDFGELGFENESPFTPEQANYTWIDCNEIEQLSGGDSSTAVCILNAYLDSNDQEVMRGLLGNEERQTLSSIAHKIKGALMYLGASRASEIAFEIESEATEIEVEVLIEKVTSLDEAMNHVRREVEQYLEELQQYA